MAPTDHHQKNSYARVVDVYNHITSSGYFSLFIYPRICTLYCIVWLYLASTIRLFCWLVGPLYTIYYGSVLHCTVIAPHVHSMCVCVCVCVCVCERERERERERESVCSLLTRKHGLPLPAHVSCVCVLSFLCVVVCCPGII